MTFYDDTARALAAKTALWALPLFDRDQPPEALGTLALDTSRGLRALAIMALLGPGNEQQFLANLSRSARAWALFLRRAKGATPRPHHYVSGRIEPILDGIAAGDDAAITSIRALAPADKQGRSEYEDDFCYARLLLGLMVGPDEIDTLAPLIDRFRAFDDGARVAACDALLRRDAGAFSPALTEIIEAFQRRCAEEAEVADATPEVIARSSICIEALALLRLAERRLFSVPDEHPLCPAQARLSLQGAFPEDFGG
jgi:hypothetical protein